MLGLMYGDSKMATCISACLSSGSFYLHCSDAKGLFMSGAVVLDWMVNEHWS